MEEFAFGPHEIRFDFWRMENLQMLINFILVAGMTLAALMVFFILKTRITFSGKLPALFFASGFFFALYYYAFMHRAGVLAGIAIIFGQGMGFLLGPSLLFFVKSLREEKSKFIRPYLIQLTPYLVNWILISLPLGLNLIFQNWFPDYSQVLADIADFTNLVENAFLIFYAYLAYREVQKTEGLVKQSFSTLGIEDLSWCKTLVYGIGIIVLTDSLLSIYELIYPPVELVLNPGLIIAILLIAFFAILGYKGTVQAKILLPDFLLEKQQPSSSKSITSADSLFSEKQAKEAEIQLIEVMEVEHPYLDESLALSDLANRIDLTDKRLSELLNKHLETNFYDFVNSYRVAAFKEKLMDHSYAHLTLLALAYESGFKSKTSFNRVFKQQTGQSPSAYKKTQESALQKASA
ncbi:helix-turn-helix domain-containing protein [Cryomorphaceae bacterium 1068]|nr:helix-turn-helix domain-containing protein [Cryomorphaceae bacterium 1068]